MRRAGRWEVGGRESGTVEDGKRLMESSRVCVK